MAGETLTLRGPRAINTVIEASRSSSDVALPLASGNPRKVEELRRMGIDAELAPHVHPLEIQGNLEQVLRTKAISAFLQNRGKPTLVEDSGLEIDALGGYPGVYTKDTLGDPGVRDDIARMLPLDNRGATFRVGIAIATSDKPEDVQIRYGATRGRIAERRLEGPYGFTFDDIFIPQGDTQTYANLPPEVKDQTSARGAAYAALKEHPFIIGGNIFQLSEPSVVQLQRIKKERLAEHPEALEYAFSLQLLQVAGIQPNAELKVEADQLPPFHKVEYGTTQDGKSAIWEYTVDPSSASMGLVILPEVDLKAVQEMDGTFHTLRLDAHVYPNPEDPDEPIVEPILRQMGPRAIEQALASRAAEFIEMHSPQMHARVLGLLRGEIHQEKRSHTRSRVLENLLGMRVVSPLGKHMILRHPTVAIATKELGYNRKSHKGKVSRRAAAEAALMLGPDGVVSSLFALGGMPPVTGSRDAIVTAAVSYMRSWIPRNGLFAGNFARQLKLFEEARDTLQGLTFDEDPTTNKLIRQNAINQIGLSVGCENPEEIAQQVRQFKEAGGHAVRIYTTNPDDKIVETAKAIRDAVGKDFLICVGPVTDVAQAKRLKREADVRMFLYGHGGGENCTSLTAGGAAGAIGLVYETYLDPDFQDCIIGLEGGTGTTIGALLPMVDVIAYDKRGVGGIESTQGLYVQLAKMLRRSVARGVLLYPGSASAWTQLIEAYLNLDKAERSERLDGLLRAIEGTPGTMDLHDAERSNTNAMQKMRAYLGVALADQQSGTSDGMSRLRKRVKRHGHNHIAVTPEAAAVANEHRGRN